MNDVKNYYDILEVPVTASQEEISQGYNRARNAYSQDSLALYSLITKEECHEMLDMIDEAYSILSDPQKRMEYNRARNLEHPFSGQHHPHERVSPHSNPFETPMQSAPIPVQSTVKKDIPKIVANKRFSLDFEVNPDFEQEIENTAEFNGEFLRKIREYKNVDIERMADMTKVSKTYLNYIEEEVFHKLPAPVYVRGFVYQYAKCLKLNPDLVANSYLYKLKNTAGKKAV